MIEQLKTIREALETANLGLEDSVATQQALAALTQLEAMVGEPVATVTSETGNPDISMSWWHEPALPVGTKLYASPVAQQPQTESDAYCITTPDGDCISTDPRCMHQPQAEAVPPGYALVPVDVLKAASESLGNFVSDHGWTDADMQAMDNLDAIIAQQKGQP